ncbi:MAG: hypothetical protein ACSHX6_06350 [Akkermansiaceae bacterium]
MMRLLLFLFSFVMSPGWACEEYGDPFGDDEARPLVPREAAYLEGGGSVDGEVEVLVRSLPMLLQSLENLPLVKRDLEGLPHTIAGDEVYDISGWFPNCDEVREDLWVVYNARSGYLIASADGLLRASVNEYVDDVVMNQLPKMRLSVTYLKVKGSVQLEMGALQGSDYRVVMRVVGGSSSGEVFEFGNAGFSVRSEVDMDYSRRGAYVSLNIVGGENEEISMGCGVEMGQQIISKVGVNDGGEQGVLILKLVYVDQLGRELDYHQRLESRLDVDDQVYRGFDFWRHHYFSSRMSVLDYLDCDDVKLVVPPADPLYREDDVVYDITKSLELQGIKIREGDRLLSNQTVGQMDFKGADKAFEQVEELFTELGVRPPNLFYMTSSFYEVEAKGMFDREWSLENVLASNPVLLGEMGGVISQGDKFSLKSEYGAVEWSAIFFDGVTEGREDDSDWIESSFEIDLKISGREIKWSEEAFVCLEKPVFVEVRRDGGKSIVMRLSIDVEEMFYHEKLHN